MDSFDWPAKLLLAFVLGALIGLEREINERKSVQDDNKRVKTALLGLRSFSLIAGLGALCGMLFFEFPLMGAIIASLFALLMISFYFFDSHKTVDFGITTELAAIYSFVIGFLLSVGIVPVQVVIALTVVVVLLMSKKESIKDFVEDIQKHEINAFVSFAILAFVILPFLPNQSYALSDIRGIEGVLKNLSVPIEKLAQLELFNPFSLWLIVVLITGVDLLGYILEKIVGKQKGWLLTSLIGGFASSTATTVSIAQESKKAKQVELLVSAAVLSTVVSFLPIALLLITLSSQLFIAFLPTLLIMTGVGIGIGIFFLRKAKKTNKNVSTSRVAKEHHIFDLIAALRFMGLFLIINIISKISLQFFGDAGFLATSAIGAVVGMDAVVINAAQLVEGRVGVALGVWALLIANSVNLLAKSLYSFLQGSKAFAFRFFLSMLVIITASVLGILFPLFKF